MATATDLWSPFWDVMGNRTLSTRGRLHRFVALKFLPEEVARDASTRPFSTRSPRRIRTACR